MEEQVLKAMKEAGKPVRPGDIAKVLGVDSKEVSKACAELKKAGKIYSPKRCYYEPVANNAACDAQNRLRPVFCIQRPFPVSPMRAAAREAQRAIVFSL